MISPRGFNWQMPSICRPKPGKIVAFIAILGLIFGRLAVRADDYSVRNWHMEEGLPDGEITAIAQTPEGYLWVGTPKGLARFDGTRFRVYLPKNTPELKDATIANLLTDHAGRLWIGTADGTMLRWSAGKFDFASQPTSSMSIAARESAAQDWHKNGNWHLVEDGAKRIWWLQHGLALVHFEEASSKVYTNLDGLSANDIEKLGRDTDGHIWAAANSRLRRFSDGHWDTIAQSIPMSWPWHEIVLQQAVGGGLLLAEPLRGSWQNYGGQVRRLKDGQWTGPFEPTPFERGSPRSIVTSLLEDRMGRMWIGTQSGGLYFSDREGQWRRIQESTSLSEGNISCLLEDAQNNIWVGTVGDGLYRVSRQPISSITLRSPAQAETPAIVQSTCESHDGSVWIGTDGAGLYHYENGITTNWGTALNPTDLYISCVLEDQQSNLWLGTKSGLLRVENGRFGPVYGPEELSHTVMSMYEDKSGRLWIGTTQELIRKTGDHFTICNLRTNQGACDVRSIVEDKAGDIWVGTLGQGLFVLKGGNTESPHRVEAFPASSARAMYCDADGTLWIGSWGDGMFRFRNGEFAGFTSEDGLLRDKILCIVPDNAGVLWMSSDNGIFGIKRQALESYIRGTSPPLLCQRLSLWQGLANRACSGLGQPVATRTRDGRLWFPNMEGVAVLDPTLAAGLKVNPTVIIESMLADGVETPSSSGEEFRAPSSIRRFEFRFASPDLAQTKDVHFRHKLEGMDESWPEASGDRIAYYSQLPPNRYKFRVAVGGSDGQWHESPQVIAFRVVPRFWEIRWVQVLASACLISALGASVAWNQRRKLRRKLERMEMQQSLEQERRRIARDLHDELGARLTSIALQGELAMRGEQIPIAAKTEIGSLALRVRQLINATDEVIWTTDPGNDSLPNLIEFLCDYIERFLTPAGVSYRLDVPTGLPQVPIQSQARHHFLLVVKETLNNVVRHSGAKLLMVRLTVEDDTLTLVIEDDGMGFDVKNSRPGGNGLANIRNRMAMVNGRAEITSVPGKGTTTTLTMPLKSVVRNGNGTVH